MVGSIPEFNPFAEHPHLGFWFLALVFKFLPSADWSRRMGSHFFYFGFLTLFFFYLRFVSGLKVAVGSVILLWTFSRFSNFFSIYLDPGCLFFGFGSIVCLDFALQKKRPWLIASVAGVAIAFCFMYKGLTALGFLPALAAVPLLYWRKRSLSSIFLACACLALVGFLILFAYYLAVRNSSVPDFFDIYLRRQWTNRLARIWQWSNLFNYSFWISLLRHTHYLAPLSLLALGSVRKSPRVILPFVLFATFAVMYAANGRVGVNYWITILPWLAWLIVENTLSKLPWKPSFLIRLTMIISIVAIFLVQYIPVRTHGNIAEEMTGIARLKKRRPRG